MDNSNNISGSRLQFIKDLAHSRPAMIFSALILTVVAVILMVNSSREDVSASADGSNTPQPIMLLTNDPFDDSGLSAQAALVTDLYNGKIYLEKNKDVPLPLASLAKLMTALVALETLPGEEVITITASAISNEGDSGLRMGEKWNLRELVRFFLVTSSNDAAAAVSTGVNQAFPFVKNETGEESGDEQDYFVTLMNAEARQIGLVSAIFHNSTGLDLDDREAGAYGSASDVSAMVRELFFRHPDVFSATSQTEEKLSSFSTVYEARNTNRILAQIPNVSASKTGFTDLAGGNLAVIFDSSFGRPISIVVLGSTQEDRFNDIQKISDAVMRSLRIESYNQRIISNGQNK
ncbi:MAG: hypothetical protein A3G59_01955 [Candidatus Taylorbacteria bacterium RIFCSPLOWO2_12_FULL_47_20]|uniref:Peptidase S11 D-alanyl-D-alanine carboxypeptidase A N-terminal domain-containing protein n=2 Tax=Candidatus Tayloriibacteriota TaxID=1817919 RepID=A0A1G2P6Y1_9BACT|nr:MAG: hypothetical protein A3H68_02525 [Candidatus Taylorbacteria bacterium RIFCSPLOWO2_02_FULL_46_40]OHA44105.1 MAG: hypothetical protein A3G59_01955 [Candidatus Taylorbacteria bacterium RIFCSPLOWO2_12_FULL_47_20]